MMNAVSHGGVSGGTQQIGGEGRSVPSSLRVGTKVTRYSNCLVDPGPSRVVHCPDLNACLISEQDPSIACNAVHFGYAIPVRVEPTRINPELARLILDADADCLSEDALAYLLHSHPQLQEMQAATAASAASEPEEDIAAIAKQISDHAEAIYQTWKSRGLAPTEILNCHSSGTNRFKPALTPTTRHTSQQPNKPSAAAVVQQQNQPWMVYNHNNHDSSVGSAATKKPTTTSTPSPVVELLSSDQTNKLERLVNNFVTEDKARQAAASNAHAQPQKTLPSSIQFALQKFERKAATTGSSNVTSRPNHNRGTTKPQHNLATSQPQSTTTTKYCNDTIEVIYPESDSSSSSSSTSSAHPSKVTSSPAATATWPLKNKIQDGGKRAASPYNGGGNTAVYNQQNAGGSRTLSHHRHSTPSSQAEFLDEVAKEEERLINALKTGIIIAEEPSSLSSTSSSTQSSSALRRNKVTSPVSSHQLSSPSPSSSSTVQSVVSAPVMVGVDTVDKGVSGNHGNQMPSSLVNGAKTVALASPGSEANSGTANSHSSSTSSVGGSSKRGRQSALVSSAASAVDHVALSRAPAPALNPVRPFLTRGSVAERVLIFEKCPTEIIEKRVKSTSPSWKTTSAALAAGDAPVKLPNYSRDSLAPTAAAPPGGVNHQHKTATAVGSNQHHYHQQQQQQHAPHTTLQRHARTHRSLLLPRFHFPNGKPPASQLQLEQTLDAIKKAFQALPSHLATRDNFGCIAKAAGCPLYWKAPLFIACGGEKLGQVEVNTFIDYWRSVCSTCHDDASKFIKILSRGQNRNHLYPEDFMPLVQDVVDTHPGLTFLKEAAEFHSRYIHTVISRIYYCVNQSWSGQISLCELRRSDLLRVIGLLELEEDINQVTQYFSYEHFYVIYCKFWELDRDHDLYIDKEDLARHSDHALSTRLIGRIFSGTVTRGNRPATQLNGQANAKMSYTEFVWFLLAEEDKMHPRAIEYWFRCMDLDGDGYLSMYELEYFYDEQLQRMEAIGIECLPFEDCLCQMLDMIRPAIPGKISLGDLKRCKMTPIFFDTFFNLEKYLDHEQRDPFASQRDHDTEMSDWDRYAAEEYELLVAEEGGNDNRDDIVFEEEDEDEDDEDNDILSPNLDEILSSQTFLNNNNNINNANYLRKKRLKNCAGTTLLNEIGNDGDENSVANFTDRNSLPSSVGREANGWQQQPFVTVTDFDNEDDSSSDYAADSDCSL